MVSINAPLLIQKTGEDYNRLQFDTQQWFVSQFKYMSDLKLLKNLSNQLKNN